MTNLRPVPHCSTETDIATRFSGDDFAVLFRAGEEGGRYCTAGWSEPEPTERWAVGRRSVLVLPAPPAVPHLLSLRLRPHVMAGRLPAQRLRVLASRVEIGTFTLTQRGERACLIPAELLTGRSALEIAFETPDAARPMDLGSGRDNRMLAIALTSLRLYPDRLKLFEDRRRRDPAPADAVTPRRTNGGTNGDAPLTLQQLMLRFESLGQNCEFGLVQRRCNAEPLGLLRFASTPLPHLLAALGADFEGMGTERSVRVEMSANGHEFMVSDTQYGLTYHAWVNAGEMEEAALHRREVRRVPMLVRKLREDLELGEKIFVFKGMEALAEEEVFPLAAALRRYGPNLLLFVTLADAAHQAGSVEMRPAGYMVGYIDRFAPGENAHDFLLDQWIAVCRQAYRLRHAAGLS